MKPRFRLIETLNAEVSRPERELLKAMYRITTADAASVVLTGALAERLGVSPQTVTASIKRLDERGVVDHVPYHGAKLTELGRRTAVATIRRHRIVERFLADMLGYAWNEADRHAAAFEHDLPQEVEDRLFVALNRPTTCPHGLPIPAAESADVPDTPPLYSLSAGDHAIVAVPGSTDPDVIAFLDTLGLRPGVAVEVVEKHPFDGPLVLLVDGEQRTLGHTVAEQVFIQATLS